MVFSFCRSATLVLAATLGLASAAAAAVPVGVAVASQTTIDCALPTGAAVPLDGTGFSDPDGDPLTYSWADASSTVLSTAAAPTLTLLPGTHVITLTVDDGQGGSATDSVEITVNADVTAPVLVLVDEDDKLWPPNHKLHDFEVADLVASVTDDCSVLTVDDVFFGHATSDEADDGLGAGSTDADVQFSDDCRTADVRAERSGTGDGRVYELLLQVQDEAGNPAEAVFTVGVPHDRAHDAAKSEPAAEYVTACAGRLSSCAPGPFECTEALEGDITLRDTKKGPSLRWRSSGFPAGSVSGAGNAVCAYLDDVAVGGSFAPDKVKVKDKKDDGFLVVKTRGDDLDLPSLPLDPGTLRLELHDGADLCVSYEEVIE